MISRSGPATLDFSGRRVAITGATRGIGAVLADAFETAGATLLLTGTLEADCDRRNAARSSVSRREYVAVDFSEPRAVQRFCEIVTTQRIDVLVNNAGVNRVLPFGKISAADYDWLTAVDLRAPLLVSQAAAQGMKERAWGRIISIASIWAVVTKPGRALYTAAKSALVGMTRTLAVELAPHGVLVNAVSPGFTRTELTASTLSPEEMSSLAAQVPSGRFAEPYEMAYVVMFLASDLNSYLTGQNVVVDGGFTIV